MIEEEFMQLAIKKAREGIESGQLPFGACIVKDGCVVACMYNTILRDGDVTAHAEINSIHEACRALNTLDLGGCAIYCTCEPCPMCIGALGLANVDRIVYGARIGDVRMDEFIVLETPGELFQLIGNGRMSTRGDVLRDENVRLFKDWEKRQYGNSPD